MRASQCLGMFGLTVWLAAAGAAPARAAPKYNVVIVTADTMRADLLGCNGNLEVKTPNLDALAGEGINFVRAYTNITTTTPSHATLFSSLYPCDHKIYSNRGRVPDEVVTLDEILHRNGWTTAAIINMPWLNPDKGNVLQMLDRVADCREPRRAQRTTHWALDYFDQQKKNPKPFFLWIHYVDNHTPYHAPGRFERMYYPAGRDPRAGRSGSLQDVWSQFPTHHQNEPAFQKWLAGITDVDYVVGLNKGSVGYVDLQVGKLVERLKHNGQWRRTLFVFTSDHGESLGEHHIWFAHSGLYEPTARVPLILRVPGGPSNRFVRTLVSLSDVMPTLLARLGLEVPAQARGRDVWPALINDDPTGSAVFLEHAGQHLTGVVTPRYKYVRHLRDRSYNPLYLLTKGREELYDLEDDPQETRDLAAERPELVERLRKLWKTLAESRGSDLRAARAPVDAQTEELLRSLGYTQ